MLGDFLMVKQIFQNSKVCFDLTQIIGRNYLTKTSFFEDNSISDLLGNPYLFLWFSFEVFSKP